MGGGIFKDPVYVGESCQEPFFLCGRDERDKTTQELTLIASWVELQKPKTGGLRSMRKIRSKKVSHITNFNLK
jgi:hypothetical protein